MSGIRADHAGGLALVLFALAVMFETRKLPIGTLATPGPGFLPVVLAAILAALGGLIMLRGAGSSRLGAIGWNEARPAALILATCAGAALLIERLGYRATMFLMVAFALGVVERRHPIAVLFAAALLSWGSFLLFADLLRVPLPRGPWGF